MGYAVPDKTKKKTTKYGPLILAITLSVLAAINHVVWKNPVFENLTTFFVIAYPLFIGGLVLVAAAMSALFAYLLLDNPAAKEAGPALEFLKAIAQRKKHRFLWAAIGMIIPISFAIAGHPVAAGVVFLIKLLAIALQSCVYLFLLSMADD